jgi:hypothetical protein
MVRAHLFPPERSLMDWMLLLKALAVYFIVVGVLLYTGHYDKVMDYILDKLTFTKPTMRL